MNKSQLKKLSLVQLKSRRDKLITLENRLDDQMGKLEKRQEREMDQLSNRYNGVGDELDLIEELIDDKKPVSKSEKKAIEKQIKKLQAKLRAL